MKRSGMFVVLNRLVGWWRDVRSVRECKSILRANLDRDYDEDDSLRTLTVVAVNALYWARRNPPNKVISETARKKELGIQPNNALCVKCEAARKEDGQ